MLTLAQEPIADARPLELPLLGPVPWRPRFRASKIAQRNTTPTPEIHLTVRDIGFLLRAGFDLLDPVKNTAMVKIIQIILSTFRAKPLLLRTTNKKSTQAAPNILYIQ